MGQDFLNSKEVGDIVLQLCDASEWNDPKTFLLIWIEGMASMKDHKLARDIIFDALFCVIMQKPEEFGRHMVKVAELAADSLCLWR